MQRLLGNGDGFFCSSNIFLGTLHFKIKFL
jgi:hypothetical protein